VFHQTSPMESSLPRYPVVRTIFVCRWEVESGTAFRHLENQFPGSIWVRFSSGTAAAAIVFS
jgi:hypothetical protein